MLDEEGYFYSTIDDLYEATTLKRSVQDRAIKKLIELNLIFTKLKQIPAKRHFKINFNEKVLENIMSDKIDQNQSDIQIEDDTNKEEIIKKNDSTYSDTFLPDNKQQTSLSFSDKLECCKTSNKNVEERQQILSNKSKDNKSKDIYQILSYQECLDLIKSQIDYDAIRYDSPNDSNRLDEIVSIMADILLSDAKTFRVNKENKTAEIVKSQFSKISMGHVKYVLNSLKDYDVKARNIKALLITSLYNSVLTINNYYTNLVNCNFNKRNDERGG